MTSEGKTTLVKKTKVDDASGKQTTKTTEKDSILGKVIKLSVLNISCFVKNREKMEDYLNWKAFHIVSWNCIPYPKKLNL